MTQKGFASIILIAIIVMIIVNVNGANSWEDLKSSLTEAGIGITTISNDPLYPAKTYEYGVSSDQQNYALKAVLEDANNPALADDVDGIIYTLNCDDPAYCVRF